MIILGTPIDILTLCLVILVFLLMLYFARKEHLSRRTGGYADYKALIVSIGVLGTFVGIFIGLWQFNTADIEGSVPNLLEGLKLAFATSILGMAVSSVLAAMEKADASGFSDEAVIPPKNNRRCE